MTDINNKEIKVGDRVKRINHQEWKGVSFGNIDIVEEIVINHGIKLKGRGKWKYDNKSFIILEKSLKDNDPLGLLDIK